MGNKYCLCGFDWYKNIVIINDLLNNNVNDDNVKFDYYFVPSTLTSFLFFSYSMKIWRIKYSYGF